MAQQGSVAGQHKDKWQQAAPTHVVGISMQIGWGVDKAQMLCFLVREEEHDFP